MSTTLSELAKKSCKACQGGAKALDAKQVSLLLGDLPGWNKVGDEIQKEFAFKNYYETMAFVNASAWISHREDHHPDLEVGYNQATVAYMTHAIKGISENDFICAAKLDALFDL